MYQVAIVRDKPFYLFIGRKRQRIVKPWQFEIEQDVADIGDDLMPMRVIRSVSYRLLVDGKLFASVTVFPKQRYQRAPVRLVKPKRGPLQIHLVKKYV